MPRENKNQLQARWTDDTDAYPRIRHDIHALLNEPGLMTLREIAPRIDDRLDLRGLDLHDWNMTEQMEFENAFKAVDFSYAKLGQGIGFHRSTFNDCLFDHAEIGCTFWGSRFDRCQFEKTVVHFALGSTEERKQLAPGSKKRPSHYAEMGIYGYETFEHCRFIKTKFKKYSSFGAIHRNCLFDHCDIGMSANYFESVFEDCKFIGALRGKVFIGYQQWPPNENTLFNSMRGVDFSECELTYMSFYYQCDLSSIVPPDEATHCIYPCTQAFAEQVENVGRERAMDQRYPPSSYPSFAGAVVSLHQECGASLEFMIESDPDNAEVYRQNENFERHRFSSRYGLITPRDHLREDKQYQEDMFEVFVEAKRRLASTDASP